MIFLDTSAIYALADLSDPNHGKSREAFRRLLGEGEDVLTHSYVLVEATALLQHRLGLASAIKFLEDSDGFHVHWVSSQDHQEAVGILKDRGSRGLSLVDCTSFIIMRHYQVNSALAFDADFEQEGFVLYPDKKANR